MPEKHRHHVHLYSSKKHIAAVLFFLVIPFVFFLIFSRLASIAFLPLLGSVFISVLRLFAAYIIAALLGFLFAVLFYRGKRAIIALPLFDVLQSFPTFAALPLVAYIWGVSNVTIIFFLVITIIWPIFFSIISSLKLVRHDWYDAAKIAGLSGFKYFRMFLLPVTIPGLVTGSIVGLGEGWEAIVATEIIVKTQQGLGPFFQHYSQNATITMFGILGFLLLIFSANKLVWLPLLEWSHHMLEE